MQTSETLKVLIQQEQEELDRLSLELDQKKAVIEGLKQTLAAYSAAGPGNAQPTKKTTQETKGSDSSAEGFENSLPSLSGMTVAEAAFTILKAAGKPIHHKEIYEIASRHGYEAAKTQRLSLKIQSFYAMFDRRSDLFVRTKNMEMALTAEAKKMDRVPRRKTGQQKTSPDTPRFQKVRDCLKKHGPCNRATIVRTTGLTYNSVSQVLLEPEFVMGEKPHTWELASKNGKEKTTVKKKK